MEMYQHQKVLSFYVLVFFSVVGTLHCMKKTFKQVYVFVKSIQLGVLDLIQILGDTKLDVV